MRKNDLEVSQIWDDSNTLIRARVSKETAIPKEVDAGWNLDGVDMAKIERECKREFAETIAGIDLDNDSLLFEIDMGMDEDPESKDGISLVDEDGMIIEYTPVPKKINPPKKYEPLAAKGDLEFVENQDVLISVDSLLAEMNEDTNRYCENAPIILDILNDCFESGRLGALTKIVEKLQEAGRDELFVSFLSELYETVEIEVVSNMILDLVKNENDKLFILNMIASSLAGSDREKDCVRLITHLLEAKEEKVVKPLIFNLVKATEGDREKNTKIVAKMIPTLLDNGQKGVVRFLLKFFVKGKYDEVLNSTASMLMEKEEHEIAKPAIAYLGEKYAPQSDAAINEAWNAINEADFNLEHGVEIGAFEYEPGEKPVGTEGNLNVFDRNQAHGLSAAMFSSGKTIEEKKKALASYVLAQVREGDFYAFNDEMHHLFNALGTKKKNHLGKDIDRHRALPPLSDEEIEILWSIAGHMEAAGLQWEKDPNKGLATLTELLYGDEGLLELGDDDYVDQTFVALEKDFGILTDIGMELIEEVEIPKTEMPMLDPSLLEKIDPLVNIEALLFEETDVRKRNAALGKYIVDKLLAGDLGILIFELDNIGKMALSFIDSSPESEGKLRGIHRAVNLPCRGLKKLSLDWEMDQKSTQAVLASVLYPLLPMQKYESFMKEIIDYMETESERKAYKSNPRQKARNTRSADDIDRKRVGAYIEETIAPVKNWTVRHTRTIVQTAVAAAMLVGVAGGGYVVGTAVNDTVEGDQGRKAPVAWKAPDNYGATDTKTGYSKPEKMEKVAAKKTVVSSPTNVTTNIVTMVSAAHKTEMPSSVTELRSAQKKASETVGKTAEIKKGDSFHRIAQREIVKSGIKMRPVEMAVAIAKENGMTFKTVLKPGKTIEIPGNPFDVVDAARTDGSFNTIYKSGVTAGNPVKSKNVKAADAKPIKTVKEKVTTGLKSGATKLMNSIKRTVQKVVPMKAIASAGNQAKSKVKSLWNRFRGRA